MLYIMLVMVQSAIGLLEIKHGVFVEGLYLSAHETMVAMSILANYNHSVKLKFEAIVS